MRPPTIRLEPMDAETRAAFGRMDHYFELMQAQHLEVRADLARMDTRMSRFEERMSRLEERMSRLEERMSDLEESVRSFRDWVTIQFAELRAALQQLTARVDRLEQRYQNANG